MAASDLSKCRLRLKLLRIAHAEGGYSDVVREAQELVELAWQAVLHAFGAEVPKVPDLGPVLLRHRDLLPSRARARLDEIGRISKRLRKERELAFYGTEDVIPTEVYTEEESMEEIRDAKTFLEGVEDVLRA